MADVPALVRSLIEQVTTGPDSIELSRGLTDVMLDVQVDGVRCLLFRIDRASPSSMITLSPREREIARMVAKGYPNKTIAAVLEISSWTVGTYLRRIFAKLGVGTRASMVARLLKNGDLEGEL